MGYGVTAYAVDMDSVRALLGSRDEGAFEAQNERLDAGEIDELIESSLDGEPGPRASDVLRQMVFGEAYDTRLGFAYAYVFEQLCRSHGQFLDNSAWMPIRFGFFEQIGRALERAGVSSDAFNVECLISRKTPIPLPPIDEFPAVGGLAEDEVEPAAEALAKADLNAISDVYEREAIEALRDWTQRCAERRRALLCFYS